VVVENKPGAGGNIGADYVAKSAPDGHTLVMGAIATHAINPALYPKLPYDPVRDFRHIALVVQVPNVLVLNNDVPARSVAELIDFARKNPGKLDFASGSTGSTGHLAGELFKQMTGTYLVHIPYKGAAPALTDLLGGQVSMFFSGMPPAMTHVKSGKLRALAVTTTKRSPAAPDVPTMAEAGIPGFDISNWFGVFAPAGTPEDILNKLNAEIVKALALPDVKVRLAGVGAETVGNSRAEFAAFIDREIAKYAKLARESGAKVE
jgi:tripartite-type tricarboxylate transporter receptor subunit TctC